MQNCLLCVALRQRFLLLSSKGQSQKCIQATSLSVYPPGHGHHVETTENQTKPHVRNYLKKTFKKNRTTRKSEHVSLNPEMLQSSEQKGSGDTSQQKTTNPSFVLYRSDGVDPVLYSLIYNNIKETEVFGRTRFGVANVFGRMCVFWMFGNIAVASVVNFHVIPHHLQIMIFAAFGLYSLGFWRFLKIRKGYREAVFRLYREKHGINKKYIMIKPYRFMYSEQKVFSESDLKKLDSEKNPERFKLDWRKYRLVPENFTEGHETFLWDILGQKIPQKNDNN
ncbi:hypothetical protein KP79_PYT01334 [Mizuhopecten yessoensis]|uniref:Uncharacterized protein n=1 Tax=Mizuhopecten yessoensis TaxID=6573 RepID=A0A210QF53_MIZYE|nr:hypothetical protein KP79_PYT01334 [Mizuhopecten yessoensis]